MNASKTRFERAVLTVAVLAAASLTACGDRPETGDSGETAAVPAVAQVGEIKGILVAAATRRPLGVIPNLFRDAVEGEDREEVRRMMDAIEQRSDSVGSFHFTSVPPGFYHLVTRRQGIIGEGFTVKGGEVVDLGAVEVP